MIDKIKQLYYKLPLINIDSYALVVYDKLQKATISSDYIVVNIQQNTILLREYGWSIIDNNIVLNNDYFTGKRFEEPILYPINNITYYYLLFKFKRLVNIYDKNIKKRDLEKSIVYEKREFEEKIKKLELEKNLAKERFYNTIKTL